MSFLDSASNFLSFGILLSLFCPKIKKLGISWGLVDNSCPFVVEQDINSGFCVYVGGECVDTSCPPIVGMYDTGCKAILWSMALAIRVSCAVYGTGN